MFAFVFKIITSVFLTMLGIGISLLWVSEIQKASDDNTAPLGFAVMIIVFVMSLVSVWL